MNVRILVILQLCVAFTVLLGRLGAPFLEDLYEIKGKMLLYENVMGIKPLHSQLPEEMIERLNHNRNAFDSLPEQQKRAIINQYEATILKRDKPFLEKFRNSFIRLGWETSVFKLSWILLSIVISVMVLLRKEGTAQAVWLIPLLAFCYAYENQFYKKSFPFEDLYPTESEIVENYLGADLSDQILEQREQLLAGWKRYLVIKLAKEEPKKDSIAFDRQWRTGEYAFDLARLKKFQLYWVIRDPKEEKESNLLIVGYLFWNLLFALKVYKLKDSTT